MMMIIFLSSHAAWYKKNSDNQYFLIISLQQNFYAPSIKMHNVRVENLSESFLLEPFLIKWKTWNGRLPM